MALPTLPDDQRQRYEEYKIQINKWLQGRTLPAEFTDFGPSDQVLVAHLRQHYFQKWNVKHHNATGEGWVLLFQGRRSSHP